MESEKVKNKKLEYHPEKYTEKCIANKMVFIIFQILLLCLTFGIMFLIATKKVISSISVMLSCHNELHLSYLKLFLIGFFIILIFILLLTLILYLLNKLFRIKLNFKQAISIVTSSYIYFALASIVASILFIVGWGYLGYILILAIFFLTQFNVYQTYYSLVEHHGKRFSFIVAIIYSITSIITFIILNITIFSYIKTLYTSIC